jgi:hypothetical protein
VRKRYGIPLMILLAVVCAIGATFLPFQPIYVVVWATAIWAAFDSKKLEVTQYDSSLAIAPIGVLIALVLFWPITFPWYLKLHWRIKNGEIGQRGEPSMIPFIVFGVFLLFVGAGVYLVMKSPTMVNLMGISVAASAEYRQQVKVSLSGRDLTLSINDANIPKDSASRARVARGLATFALGRYSDPSELKTISVDLKDETQTNGVTITRGHNNFRWTIAQLRDSTRSGVLAANNTGAATVTPAGAPAKPGTLAKSGARAPAPTPTTSSISGARRTPPMAASPTAYTRLAAADPTVRWETTSALVADIDCDNVADTVVVGRKRGEIHVGLARASDPEPQILVFDVGVGVKGSVSGPRAQVSLESLDFDPADKGLHTLAGFERSGTCRGLTFGDEGKPKVHVFWSRQTRHVEWFQR